MRIIHVINDIIPQIKHHFKFSALTKMQKTIPERVNLIRTTIPEHQRTAQRISALRICIIICADRQRFRPLIYNDFVFPHLCKDKILMRGEADDKVSIMVSIILRASLELISADSATARISAK